ncbi:MAG: serine dehydratase beta chain, partial [Woeseiaceae bacterium]
MTTSNNATVEVRHAGDPASAHAHVIFRTLVQTESTMSAISIFDIFKIGVGPSSSHTVGPMKAAREFVQSLAALAQPIQRVEVRLHGSLAHTGKGHGTDSAILLGLSGKQPDTVDPDSIEDLLRRIHKERVLDLPDIGQVAFAPDKDLQFDFAQELPRHT